MRKEVVEKQVVSEEKDVIVSKSAICNKCGKEFNNHDSSHQDYYNESFWDAEISSFGMSFGYGSRYDCENWSFDLCEDCLTDLIKTFKYPPDGFRDDGCTAIGSRMQMVFDHWKETGEWEELFGASYEEVVDWQDIWSTDYINEYIKRYHPDKPLITDTDNEL